MSTFSKEEDCLVETKEVSVSRTRKDLLEEKAMYEREILRAQAYIKKLDALLAECDKLGL